MVPRPIKLLVPAGIKRQRAQSLERRRTKSALERDPILLYQMGKVGSQTINETLSSMPGLERPILHLHTLEMGRLQRITEFGVANRRPHFAWRGLETADAIAREPERRWTVITLVRDPVARDVSSFFQNIDSVIGFDVASYLDEGRPVAEIAKEIWPLFQRIYIDSTSHPLLHVGYEWFEFELEATFQIDVYATPFPQSEGFQIVGNDRARVLILRVEDLDRVGVPALREFLGVEVPRLIRANTVEAKILRDVASVFKQVPFPEDYLERAYGSRLARHFYTAGEIELFRAKWRTPEVNHPGRA